MLLTTPDDINEFKILEDYLRDIFENPNDSELLENRLEKMKPYLMVEDNQIQIKPKFEVSEKYNFEEINQIIEKNT